MISDRFIVNIKTNEIHRVDEYYSVDGIDVVFTMDEKCLPLNHTKSIGKDDIKRVIAYSFCNEIIEKQDFTELKNRLHENATKYSFDPNNVNPSWMRKVISYLSRLKRRVCD